MFTRQVSTILLKVVFFKNEKMHLTEPRMKRKMARKLHQHVPSLQQVLKRFCSHIVSFTGFDHLNAKKLSFNWTIPGLCFIIFAFSMPMKGCINFDENWIQTNDLRCLKRPLNQLSHNHCPHIATVVNLSEL